MHVSEGPLACACFLGTPERRRRLKEEIKVKYARAEATGNFIPTSAFAKAILHKFAFGFKMTLELETVAS